MQIGIRFSIPNYLLMAWKRVKQSFDKGRYAFSGKPLLSGSMYLLLPDEEISEIIQDVRNYVKQNGLVDYIQIYENESNERILCIDNISVDDIQDMKDNNEFTEEEIDACNYWTMVFDYN